MEQMNQEMLELRETLNKEIDKVDTKNSIVAVEEKVIKLVETVEKQRSDNDELHDCVQDAVWEKLQQDKEKLEDIEKRSTNFIIHGLKEINDDDGEARKKADEDQVMKLLLAIRERPIRVKRPMSDVLIFRRKNSDVRFQF